MDMDDLAFQTLINLLAPDGKHRFTRHPKARRLDLVREFRTVLKKFPIGHSAFATPETSVVAESCSLDFFMAAKKAQQNWLREFRSNLSNRTLRQEWKWSSPLERQLLFTGVMIADGKHLANDQWRDDSQKQGLQDQSFGCLKVIKRLRGRWLCICSCGNSTTVSTSRLLNGKTQSCGCIKREREARLNLANNA